LFEVREAHRNRKERALGKASDFYRLFRKKKKPERAGGYRASKIVVSHIGQGGG